MVPTLSSLCLHSLTNTLLSNRLAILIKKPLNFGPIRGILETAYSKQLRFIEEYSPNLKKKLIVFGRDCVKKILKMRNSTSRTIVGKFCIAISKRSQSEIRNLMQSVVPVASK